MVFDSESTDDASKDNTDGKSSDQSQGETGKGQSAVNNLSRQSTVVKEKLAEMKTKLHSNLVNSSGVKFFTNRTSTFKSMFGKKQ